MWEDGDIELLRDIESQLLGRVGRWDSNPRSSISKAAGVASSRALGVAVSLVELSGSFCDSASSIGFECGVVGVGTRFSLERV